MKRLLNSLAAAEYGGKVKLYISIDGGGNEAVKEAAKVFEWKYGEKELIFHDENLGLRQHILKCGDLALNHDGIILLEDDLMVAGSFYAWAMDAFGFFRNDGQVEGISLYSHPYNETSQFPFWPLEDGSDNFFFQYSPSWGQVWYRSRWEEFRDWYNRNKHIPPGEGIMMPQNILYWPASSWKKYYIHYLIENDRYFAYPRRSLTTVFGGEGTNIRVKETFLQAPLWHGKKDFVFSSFENSAAVYDCFGEMLPGRLVRQAPHLAKFDLEVDLYGMKPLEQSGKEYVLSGRQARNPVMSFGREMKPHEENVIRNIPGKDIHLARREDFGKVRYLRKLLKVHHRKMLAYWYPLREYHFSGSRIISTGKDPEKHIDPPFLARKFSAVTGYAYKYFCRK